MPFSASNVAQRRRFGENREVQFLARNVQTLALFGNYSRTKACASNIRNLASRMRKTVQVCIECGCAWAGFVDGKEHFTTGIRVGSGVTVADFDAASRLGFAAMQGYLVPNS